ncbi:MAG: type II toxin-antitoxin system HicB family antitoxin [Collinsella sp.]|uniref:type II toxin-antitoxin system HicB family antitoxin n=1 Tax=Collinsella sp. i06-0019-1H4 TaxID=3132706 RepID=UPI0024CCE880|nr:type II toxin-antitoxin system HicB family antitoxin [Collinsella sp.]UYI99139.1 MAG: type II toxin-antitoxin system HicB family antitoxin [Coriobacteriaceae bacterium]
MGKYSSPSWMVAGGKMRQRFTYDCVLIKEDDGYCASFPQIPGTFADGDTREEAIAHATEALMAFLADDLNNGLTPAGYERSAEVVALSVEIDHDDAREAACRTFKDAALDLKVSASRITALVKAGKLDVELVDGRRMITIDSIERYAAQERHAGRPKKFVAVQ